MADEPVRVAWRSYHDWVLPVRGVQVLLAGALLFLFLGLVLLAVGGGAQVGGLVAAGGVLAGIGGCGLLVCLLLCLHAYFIFNVRDQSCQTPEYPWSDDVHSTQEIPGYAVINKPSALKAADTLRRNGGNGGVKKVTMAPDVALDADVRAPALRTTASGDMAAAPVSSTAPNLALASPTSPGYRTLGPYAVIGAGGGFRGARTSAESAGMESFDQRSYAQQQQFQDMQQKQLKHQQMQLQQQRGDSDIHRQRQQLELHRQNLLQQHQSNKLQQQQQQLRVQVQQPSQAQSVTYAQIQRYPVAVQHSPSPSMSSQHSSVFTSATGSLSGGGGGGGFSGVGTVSSMGGASGYGYGAGTGTGSSVGTARTTSSFGSYKIHTQGLQYQSGRPYVEDDDYDNPAESTPMLAASPRSTTASAKEVTFSGGVSRGEEEVPEPAPLQYPSERRPMTFEQQSSSKMSIYDNVLFPYAEADGE